MAEAPDPSSTELSFSDLASAVAELRREVSQLRAKDDIRDLIVRYAKACDVGNDPILLAPLFTHDASWECKGFGRYEGRETVAKALKAIAGSRIWWSLHYMISPEIVLDADGQGATLFWYLWEAATLPNEYTGTAEAYWIGATYDARARLADGAWLFSAMELKLTLASPFSRGWVEKRFPDGTPSQPYFAHVTAGEHLWCACGKSKSQPFCDGSHEGGKAQPMRFTATVSGTAVLCGCRYSRTKPFCDGSHLNLKL